MGQFVTAFMIGCSLISIAFSFCYLYGTASPNPGVVYFGFFIGVSSGSFAWAIFFTLKEMIGKI